MSDQYNNNSYDAVLSRMEQKLDTIAENIDNIKKTRKTWKRESLVWSILNII
jgi:hypothetical protein